MRKAKIKRILSVLCAASLLMTAFPVCTFATENATPSETMPAEKEEVIAATPNEAVQTEETSSEEGGIIPEPTPSETGNADLPDEEVIIDDVNIASPSETDPDEGPLMMLMMVSQDIPTIAEKRTWYRGLFNKNKITEAHFTDAFEEEIYDETWEAGATEDDSITCYLVGTALYICSNGSTSIKAAKNSSSFFSGFTVLSEITGLEMIDFSETTNAHNMFYNCDHIDDELALYIMENIGENSITDFSGFFSLCDGLVNVTVPEDLDTSHAANISEFFYKCTKLVSADLSGFNSGTYTTVDGVVSSCSKLISLDLRGFDTSSVTSTVSPFSGVNYLEEITMDGAFTLKKLLPVPSSDYIDDADGKWHSVTTGFRYGPDDLWPSWEDTYVAYDSSPCDTLTMGLYFTDYGVERQDITTIRFDLDYEPDGTEQYTWILDEEESGDINGHILADGKTIVVSAPGLEKIYFNPDSSFMFSVFNYVTSIEGLEYCDGSLIEDASYMFHACISLESVNLENLISSSCMNMFAMFYGCRKLKDIDITSWDTSNVTNMGQLFRECHEAESIDMTGLDTGNVVNMGFMFEKCYELKDLKLCNTPAYIRYMPYMFSECSSITDIDLSSWECIDHTDGDIWGDDPDFFWYDDTYWHEDEIFGAYEGMFRDCSSLKKLNIESVNTGNTTATTDMFDGCIRLEEITLPEAFMLKDQLPDPDSTYIEGATGLWYTASGSAYAKEDIPAETETYYGYPKKKKITFEVYEKSDGIFKNFGPDVLRYKIVSEDNPDEYIRFTVCFDENDDYSDYGRCQKDREVYLSIGDYSYAKSKTIQKDCNTSPFSISSDSISISSDAYDISHWNRAKAAAYIGTL